ncbi:MAG: Glu/Leu/Phe/Val dehydrogenase [Chitinophagales bacterium]|nr:Glu/Leu/Phe/Val dehydrogenase [Chitinophagales bacterium]
MELTSNLFSVLSEMEHEQIVHCYDKETGLRAIIAIHNTALGPSLGGTRVWKYSNEADALQDVLRLSRGMTFKSSISGINLGGGKAVILADDNFKRDERYWRKYGEFVNSLGGKYITAEDVGTSTKEIEYIAKETKHVAGKPFHLGGSGDPSPFTAYGVYVSMKASWKKLTGNDSLTGVKVAVQGTGHVGQYLIDHLMSENAVVSIADINQANLELVTNKYNTVQVVAPNDIATSEVDIYSPCALGATLNPTSIPLLKCKVVCGAANNQLKDEIVDGNAIMQRGILYAPDFLINAGGVINCYTEAIGDYSKEKTMQFIEPIYNKVIEIFEKSANDNINPQLAAMAIAKERIANAKPKSMAS